MPDRKDDDFANLVGPARRLRGPKLHVPGTTTPSLARGDAVAFVFPERDVPNLARAEDCDAKTFGRLRRGRIEPEDDVDLHGLRQEEARELLTAELRRAWDAGLDCVRVVHGKGTRSPDGRPVLRSLLPEWLTTAPIGPNVFAFAPARPDRGGSGATLVLFRA